MEEQEQQFIKKERRQARRQEKALDMQQSGRGKAAKRLSFWLFILILLIGAGYGVIKLANSATNQTQSFLNDEVSESDWVKGNPQAETILVEYSDFQCPACATYFPMIKQLSEEFAEDIQFVYRHFPLSRIHPNATAAAVAAEAAGRQGKFWKMHDLLFENQSFWSGLRNPENVFSSYAESLGLNIEQFRDDLGSDELKNKVSDQFDSGIRSQVNATPTFFLNGQKMQNPRSLDEFRNFILETLNQ